jgi:putative transposase
VFIVLGHDRRQVVHFNVTTNPGAEWTAQQVINAFPNEEAPRFLIRDRDGIYGDYFTKRVESMGIEEVPTAPRSPWQNPYCERVIGSIRRECLNHVIVLNEDHLRRILTNYFDYYHAARPHLSLDRNSLPTTRSRTTVNGRSRLNSAGRRSTPSIHASCVIVNISLLYLSPLPVRA